jgi:hypothetical protein
MKLEAFDAFCGGCQLAQTRFFRVTLAILINIETLLLLLRG